MADAGFSIPWPIVWSGGAGGGAGTTTITDNTIGTNDYSPHPINCIMIETGPASDMKKMPTDWFGPGGPAVETAKGIRRGNWFFRAPKSWLK